MSLEPHYRKLENLYASAPINNFFKPKLTVEEAKSTIKVTIRTEFFHAARAVHGSVYFKMLDDAAFFAAQSLVDDVFIVTVSFNTNLIRPVSEGILNSTGEVIRRGQRIIIAKAELFDDSGHLLAQGSGTFIPSRIPLGPDVGYQ